MEIRLDRLEVAQLVADLGSVSKAAKALGVAQSAVSRHVALLEAALGDRVFERDGRGVAVSEFGQRLLPQIRLLLLQARKLEEDAREASGIATGLVHIGILESLSRLLVGRLMSELRKKHPAVRLRISEGLSGSLDEQVTTGRLDLAIVNRYGRSAPPGEDVLGRMDTFLVGRPDNPLLAAKQTPFSQLGRVPLALPWAPNGFRLALDQIARRKRVDLQVAVESDTISALRDVLLQGDVCGLLPYHAVHEEVRQGTLVASRVVQPSIPRTIAVVTTRQKPLSRATMQVLKEIGRLVPQVLRDHGATG